MNDLLKKWTDAKYHRECAEKWNELPNGRKYQIGDTFEISLAHSKAPILVRAGQQTCGGENYWKSGHELNQAILEYLKDNWEGIWPEVLQRMKQKESSALIACQSFINNLQKQIDQEMERDNR